MKNAWIAGLFVAALAVAQSAFAADSAPAQEKWGFTAKVSGKMIQMQIEEIGSQGPACDFVLKSLGYDQEKRELSLEVEKARFCPIDAIAVRKTEFVWQIPFELRAGGSIQVIVNKELQGSLGWGTTNGVDSIVFEGAL